MSRLKASHISGFLKAIPPLIWKGPLYSAAEQKRRDECIWTLIQGVLAPVQFIVFLISLALVIRFFITGDGWMIATLSVIFKTLILYAIMITGSIWEKVVFGKYLFARPFFWEDVFSMLVLFLHTLYLAAVGAAMVGHAFADERTQMIIALAAYATYVVNAGQFIWKLRAARLSRAIHTVPSAIDVSDVSAGEFVR